MRTPLLVDPQTAEKRIHNSVCQGQIGGGGGGGHRSPKLLTEEKKTSQTTG